MSAHRYPDLCPVFHTPNGRVFVGYVRGQDPWVVYDDTSLKYVRDDLSEDEFGYTVIFALPMTISAVLMYEAAGGTLETACEAMTGLPGRRPDRLFARAHAYAREQEELGRGC